jgi:hypothetical protein
VLRLVEGNEVHLVAFRIDEGVTVRSVVRDETSPGGYGRVDAGPRVVGATKRSRWMRLIDYAGQATEVWPERSRISVHAARDAARRFVATGGRRPDNVSRDEIGED